MDNKKEVQEMMKDIWNKYTPTEETITDEEAEVIDTYNEFIARMLDTHVAYINLCKVIKKNNNTLIKAMDDDKHKYKRYKMIYSVKENLAMFMDCIEKIIATLAKTSASFELTMRNHTTQ